VNNSIIEKLEKSIDSDNYPWGNIKKEFNEDCSWHQKTYQKKYPFIRKYDGNTKHCLIDFSL